jgi:hypothetical protein
LSLWGWRLVETGEEDRLEHGVANSQE